jgi:DNA segregation ATPase FtsK/SpoIIIE-like protein
VIAELEEETEIVVELHGVRRNGVEASEPAEADEDPIEARAGLPGLVEELAGEEAGAAGSRGARARGPAERATDPAPLAGPGLFDALEAAPRAGREREVELQPMAPEPPERAHKRVPADLDPRHKLLAEVGCMFVERGRVAVSMLQRQYDMDFDEACRVLDDLQEMGLIGPYLGGQSRDILLSREQWLEKVGAA